MSLKVRLGFSIFIRDRTFKNNHRLRLQEETRTSFIPANYDWATLYGSKFEHIQAPLLARFERPFYNILLPLLLKFLVSYEVTVTEFVQSKFILFAHVKQASTRI